MVENINKLCFEYAKYVNWKYDLIDKELRYLKSSYSKKDINSYDITICSIYDLKKDISAYEVLLRALYYSKKNDYFDRYLAIIERKNGKRLADALFKKIFSNMNSISDLYDYCFNLIVTNMDLKVESKKIGINIPIINYYAGESKLGMLPLEKERLEKRKQNIIDNYPEKYQIINFLLTHDNFDEIVAFFQGLQKDVNMYNISPLAVALYPEKSYDEIKEKIVKKYIKYRNYRDNVLKADMGKRNEAYDIILKYLNSNYKNITLFCEMERIELYKFRRSVAIAKLYNNDLYNKYLEKVHKVEDKNKVLENDTLRNIVKCITYGINEREFSIVDFLSMTDYSLDTFYNIVEQYLNDFEYQKVTNFVKRYRNMNLITKAEIMKEKREINCQLDENNIPIINTGHIVTREEKEEIIDMIQKDGLLLYDAVYNQYLRDYFNSNKIKKLSLLKDNS